MRRSILFMFALIALSLSSAFGLAPIRPAQAQDTADFSAAPTFATVINARALNIRTAPGTASPVMAVAPAGAVYPVLARTADSAWWQLSLPPYGYVGWASGWFLSIPNQHLVPTVNAPPAFPANTPLGTVNTANLNVRAIPDSFVGAIITRVQLGQVYPIIGKNGGNPLWMQIALPGGGNGWVNARYLFDANAAGVPVTYLNQPTPVPGAFGTVTAYFLNVRTTPNPFIANIIAVIARGQTYTVVGRNSTSTWVQIDLGNGLRGWVSTTYFAVSNLASVPITG